MVLMIACTNVANLLLARSEARQREIAVRIAMGASRGRVLHQLTTESFLLVFAGAAAGLVLAYFGVKALVAASPISFPSYIQPDLDPMVTLFTVAISCVAAFALGLAPAIHVRPGNLHESVKQSGTRTINSRRGSRFRNTLVVTEVAFAMLLLVGAGLLIRSLRELSSIRPGYDPTHLLTLRLNLPRLPASPAPGVPPDTRSAVMVRDIVAAAAAVPAVEAVAVGTDVPLAGGGGAIFYTAEGQPPVNATNMPRAYTHRATPNFFQALRIRFVAGRAFTQAEMQPNSTAVIVSENLVKRFWPGQDPIGKRIKAGGPSSTSPWMNIVGVVNEMKYRGLPDNPTADPDIFAPFADNARALTLLVRTPLDPASIAPSVRQAVRGVDSTMVISSVSTMQELMSQQTARNRFTGWIMGIFAAAALLLAMIGIYGVMSYAVSQRTQEIGIRMALGAARTEVLGLMVRGGMLLVAVGLALGVAASLGLTRLLGTLLYGVTSTDTLTFAGAAVTLAAVALLACLVPAARATRIHPAIALRNE
jgi:putative ABC transport system permease protein